MIVNHAFASISGFSKPSPLWSLLAIPFRLGRHILEMHDRAQVWKNFEAKTQIASNCLLASKASVINFGGTEQISIGEGSVVRGILRVGDFGPARLSIGKNVYIGDDVIVSCTNSIEIGEETLIAHGVQIFDNDSHPLKPEDRIQDWARVMGRISGGRQKIASAPVKIGRASWIGFNATILKGITIGEGSVVAANSVVVSNVPPRSVVAGNPAKLVSQIS